MYNKNLSLHYQDVVTRLIAKYRDKEFFLSSSPKRWLTIYYAIGKEILCFESQVVDRTAHLKEFSRHLQCAFKYDERRFTPGNIEKMRSFALAYGKNPDKTLRTSIGLVSWKHHCEYLFKIESLKARIAYLKETVYHNWTCAQLQIAIKRRHCETKFPIRRSKTKITF